MAKGYFRRLHQETPTRLWINNPTLEEADLAIDAGAISCTTNPSYCARIIKMEPGRAARAIHAAIQESPDDQRAADIAQQKLVKEIMEKFLPVYERAPGRQGLQLHPASQIELPVDRHAARPADGAPAGIAEGQGGVLLVLDFP